jgi:hypothetical protein
VDGKIYCTLEEGAVEFFYKEALAARFVEAPIKEDVARSFHRDEFRFDFGV